MQKKTGVVQPEPNICIQFEKKMFKYSFLDAFIVFF